MGETPMRLGKVTERSWKGAKRGWLMKFCALKGLEKLCGLLSSR